MLFGLRRGILGLGFKVDRFLELGSAPCPRQSGV